MRTHLCGRQPTGDTTMFTKTKTVLFRISTDNPVHHRSNLSGAYGYEKPGNIYPATFSPSVIEALMRPAAGDPRCWGGIWDPNWNSEGE